jgi:predicted nucleic acid-binding protein
MTGEPEEHYTRCAEIMVKIEKGEERVATSILTVAELRHILSKREKIEGEKLKRMITSFLDCLGLKLLDAEAPICRDALDIADNYKVDFVDAYNVLTMMRNSIGDIYSIDDHYDMFEDIRRVV